MGPCSKTVRAPLTTQGLDDDGLGIPKVYTTQQKLPWAGCEILRFYSLSGIPENSFKDP